MAFVTLCYGPYKIRGVIRHKVQRLHGVIDQLTKLGYELEILPTKELNKLKVVMRQQLVFQCDIRSLLFNMDIQEGPIGIRLIEAVKEARIRLYSETNLPQFYTTADTDRKYREKIIRERVRGSDVQLLYEIERKPVEPEENEEEDEAANLPIFKFSSSPIGFAKPTMPEEISFISQARSADYSFDYSKTDSHSTVEFDAQGNNTKCHGISNTERS